MDCHPELVATSCNRFSVLSTFKFYTYSRYREAGTAVGQGGNKRVEGNGSLQKNNRYQLCLFLCSNNV